ncbi:MAG: hypothetical protein JNM27_16440 [Leptospirales bacterium]|nr:hypothetical protein [Leptospirales bacterium]
MRSASLQLAFVALGTCLSVACSAAPEKDKKPPVSTLTPQPLIELEGKVEVKGTKENPTTFFVVGKKTYSVIGKLERIIRGSYKNKTIKLAGIVVSEPGEKPGIFDAKEIVVILY